MCKIISVTMAKGGVGKTTTAINLGTALSNMDKSVLLIDSDPQGHMTKALGEQPDTLKYTLANILYAVIDFGVPSYIEEATLRKANRLALIPANTKLSAVDQRIVNEKASASWLNTHSFQGETVLKQLVEHVADSYDYIIIDCGTGLGALTVNALCAADSVLLPLEAHYLGFEALADTLNNVRLVQARMNPRLTVEGILITKYDARTKLCRSIKEQADTLYGSLVLPAPIPYSIKAAEQPAYGISIFGLDSRSPVATAYRQTAEAVMAHG